MSDERERCKTCGQPIGTWKPVRICWNCKRPVRKGHKWTVVDSRIVHRICSRPDSYQKG